MLKHLSDVRSHPVDRVLIIALSALIIVGLVIVYSATITISLKEGNAANFYFLKQLRFVTAGILIAILISHIEYHWWTRVSTLLIAIGVVAMLAVKYFSDGTQNVDQFFKHGSIQPSEFLKIAIIIYLAHWLATKKDTIKDFSNGLIPFAIITGITTGLILWQGDLGTASLVALTTIILFYIGGAKVHHILSFTALGAAASYLFIKLNPDRMERIFIFLSNPFAAQRMNDDTYYQAQQMLMALGSGKLTGLGLGEMGQFLYVPLKQSDAIFVVVGAEWGFIGAVALLVLYAFIAYRGFKIGLATEDPFGKLLAAGITISITIQAIIHVGGVTHSLPFTGVTLPLISQGGSSMLSTMAAFGILLAVSRGTEAYEGAENTEDIYETDDFRRRNRGSRVPGSSRY